ncbi:MAG TPA: PfkB family carbohydrate kinase, partial [Gemmataceae bacterium]|nr:PfkB family carbohydrate kinase [Gemmataceae bacterium]
TPTHLDDLAALLEILPEALAIVGRPAFVTAGEHGISLYRSHPDRSRWRSTLVPAYPVPGPIDICGAGDSCSAGITSGMVSGLTHEQAAAFGNLVASITIQQIGVTGTATPEQVRQRWREVSGGENDPAT